MVGAAEVEHQRRAGDGPAARAEDHAVTKSSRRTALQQIGHRRDDTEPEDLARDQGGQGGVAGEHGRQCHHESRRRGSARSGSRPARRRAPASAAACAFGRGASAEADQDQPGHGGVGQREARSWRRWSPRRWLQPRNSAASACTPRAVTTATIRQRQAHARRATSSGSGSTRQAASLSVASTRPSATIPAAQAPATTAAPARALASRDSRL